MTESSTTTNINDLFDKMNPKRDPENINEKKTSKNDKFKSMIKEKGMDYYAILGIGKEATQIEIKKAYQKKLRAYHPDKAEFTKENKIKYKLIREAGEILKDPHKRKAYDAEQKIISSSQNFLSQKDSFKEFLKLQENNVNPENRKIAELNFEKIQTDFNRKHNYDASSLSSDPIDKEEYNRRLDDMILQRDQEELDINHEKLFDGTFKPNEFNKLFEKKKKRDEKRKMNQDIVKHQGDVSAFNDLDDTIGGTSINNYDNLYSQGNYNDFNENYAGIGSGTLGNNNGLSDDDISIDSPDENENENDDVYESHNKFADKDSLDKKMKQAMAERTSQDQTFENMTDGNFGSALDDKFGVSAGLGFMVGNQMKGHQAGIKKRNEKLQDDTLKAYKELTEK